MAGSDFSDLENDMTKIGKVARESYEKLIVGTIASLDEAEVVCPQIGAHAAVMSMVVGLILPAIYSGVRDNQSPEAAEAWLVATFDNIHGALKKMEVEFDYKLAIKKE